MILAVECHQVIIPGTVLVLVVAGNFAQYSADDTLDGIGPFIAPYIKTPTDPADSTTRGFSGYIYGSTTSVNPNTFLLEWALEPEPITASVCGPAYRILRRSSNYILCLALVNFNN